MGLQPDFQEWHFPKEYKEAAEGLIEVMRKCWSKAPGDRPDIKEVYQQLLQTMDSQLSA